MASRDGQAVIPTVFECSSYAAIHVLSTTSHTHFWIHDCRVFTWANLILQSARAEGWSRTIEGERLRAIEAFALAEIVKIHSMMFMGDQYQVGG